jgi:hypothetical protein
MPRLASIDLENAVRLEPASRKWLASDLTGRTIEVVDCKQEVWTRPSVASPMIPRGDAQRGNSVGGDVDEVAGETFTAESD